MNSSIKKLVLLPFILLDEVKLNNNSLLWRSVNSVFADKAKLRLSKPILFNLLKEKDPQNGFKVCSYLNALGHDSKLAERFAERLIANLQTYESQLGQDCLVDTLFDGMNGGVFVEIGVGDGKKISNSYFLEKHRKWTGILCEPSTRFHDSIRKCRSAVLVTNAVYDRSDLELEFSEVVGNEELSTLARQALSDSHNRTDARKYAITTISFQDLYERFLKDKKIDYLSVDTEGSELTILNSIRFDQIDVSVISVEHNYDEAKLYELSELLGQHGYVQVLPGVFEFDAIFAKSAVIQSAERLL